MSTMLRVFLFVGVCGVLGYCVYVLYADDFTGFIDANTTDNSISSHVSPNSNELNSVSDNALNENLADVTETFEKFYNKAEFYPSTAEAIEFQNDLFTAVNDHLVAPGIGNERFRPVCNDRLCLGSFEANNEIQLSLALDRMSRSLKTPTALVQSYQDVGNGRIAVNFLINFDKPVAISRKSEG